MFVRIFCSRVLYLKAHMNIYIYICIYTISNETEINKSTPDINANKNGVYNILFKYRILLKDETAKIKKNLARTNTWPFSIKKITVMFSMRTAKNCAILRILCAVRKLQRVIRNRKVCCTQHLQVFKGLMCIIVLYFQFRTVPKRFMSIGKRRKEMFIYSYSNSSISVVCLYSVRK